MKKPFEQWVKTWTKSTPTVRTWYREFCQYGCLINLMVKIAPFPIIGIKKTNFDYSEDNFLDEPCLCWCFENLKPGDYSEVFVVDDGVNGVHRPILTDNYKRGVLMVRAIMFQNESDAAWFKLSCADRLCDAYQWKTL